MPQQKKLQEAPNLLSADEGIGVRPQATGMCGLKLLDIRGLTLLVYEALSYWYMRPKALNLLSADEGIGVDHNLTFARAATAAEDTAKHRLFHLRTTSAQSVVDVSRQQRKRTDARARALSV